MKNLVLMTTRQVAEARGVTRQHIARLVREGKLKPYATLANGSHLFSTDQANVEALVAPVTPARETGATQ